MKTDFDKSLVTRLRPWEQSLYQLFSWWDMEQFSADIFYHIGCFIRAMIMVAEKYEATEQLTKRHKKPLLDQLQKIENRCSEIKLRVSILAIQELCERLREEALTHAQLKDYLTELESTIRREMQGNLFMFIPPQRSDYYVKSHEIFSEQVRNTFLDAQTDMVEAAKCFAVARFTASVVHLMRVAEYGLNALAAHLGNIKPKPNWGEFLRAIDEALNERYGAKNPNKEEKQYYAELAGQLNIIKVAWRNPSAHIGPIYTEERAEEIFNATKAFMRLLAERIDDPKSPRNLY